MNVIIIGGGSTVAAYDVTGLTKHGYVLGVNDSSIYAECTAAITMDRLWAEHRHKSLTIPLWVRREATKNLKLTDKDVVFNCDYKSVMMVEDHNSPFQLNGTNSGFCALNLAYLMKPERVFLLGYDMQKAPDGTPYWYPAYPWADKQGATKSGKYNLWARQFSYAAETFRKHGIEVFNVTHRSALQNFKKISFKEFKGML